MADRNDMKVGITSGLIGFGAMFLGLTLLEATAAGAGDSDDDDGGGLGLGTGPSQPPAMISLTGTVRDFKERSDANGHADFERQPDLGFGHYIGNVDPVLGSDGNPVFTGGGKKVSAQWRDSEGRPICNRLFNPDLGDMVGSAPHTSNGGIKDANSFNQWFTDVPGVNMSQPLTLDFHLQPDGTYVFDDTTDSQYSSLGGFFPIEEQLFGNPGGSPDRNFHFTFELHTEFVYRSDVEQHFRFVGDDDVWVYIDGNLVIDLGGVHAAREQFVDLRRLGLVHGRVYTLDFFFAERHRTQSNFRIQTNILLESVELPTMTAAFD